MNQKGITTVQSTKIDIENVNTIFTNAEITEIKTVLKMKDISCLPLIIPAAILNKPEVISLLLEQGHDINEIGKNRMTALLWAVRYKNLELVYFLLSKGADPTITNDSGDHALFIALESKLWDEQSFILFWHQVVEVAALDMNYLSKNGRTMLHIAIRREWIEFVDLLLQAKADVNAANFNGVTPLMLACFRHNLQLVRTLIYSGADVHKEDKSGFLPLCYAMTSVIAKELRPPHMLVDEVKQTTEKRGMSFRSYVAARIKLIHRPTTRVEEKGQTISNMLPMIFKYLIDFVPSALSLLVEFCVHKALIQACQTYFSDQEHLKQNFSIMSELVFGAILYSVDDNSILLENFIEERGLDCCLRTIQR